MTKEGGLCKELSACINDLCCSRSHLQKSSSVGNLENFEGLICASSGRNLALISPDPSSHFALDADFAAWGLITFCSNAPQSF